MSNMKSYDYELPNELIALTPQHPRSSSRMLVYCNNKIIDSNFTNLCNYLNPNDRLIFNDTKVLPAKLNGTRFRDSPNGSGISNISVLLNERLNASQWTTLCKPARRLSVGDKIVFSPSLTAIVCQKNFGECVLTFSKIGISLDSEIFNIGELPLPPYIIKSRKYKNSDDDDYQSIFAENLGAVASPTASLHFDNDLIKKIKKTAINYSFVTLHVGAGTFLPIKSEDFSNHKMHAERGFVSEQTASEINETIFNGGRIIPVGTTSLRLIESAAKKTGVVGAYNAKTDIFIRPGYTFKCSHGLITNFHFPKSTLLLLVSAFIGSNQQKRIYEHAISQRYRFFSYGDGSLLIP